MEYYEIQGIDGFDRTTIPMKTWLAVKNEYWAFCRYNGLRETDIGLKSFLAGYLCSQEIDRRSLEINI